ncbi:hypothetical protein AVEN_128991-1 [Araneus ventricosus]|uniref:DUF5641 domain-containing protein n=1 Tax=Araneus ventricosus TaxID=182803 RepID=A0A4Y2GB02_ARAVE|nr:hypothetical protein AVEN_128991-1 [Araneus ventricosus]
MIQKLKCTFYVDNCLTGEHDVSETENLFKKKNLSCHDEKHLRNPQVGEIVLVGYGNKKCLFWVLAKIIELIPGRVGKIRTVKIKTQQGTVLRPIQRIYPLEIYSNQSFDKEPGGEEPNSHDVPDNENKLAPAADIIMRKYTSSGRYIKAPEKLQLLNNVCYVLETLNLKGGCCEVKRNVTATRQRFYDVNLRAD